MKARLINDKGEKTWIVVFDKGDEVKAGLLQFARENNLAAARLTAIGAFSGATLGYFDRDRKEYKKIPVDEQVEVLSLIGDIALKEDGTPALHAHVVVGRDDGTTRGGHLLEACVWPTLEVIVDEAPRRLVKKSDPETGLALISL
jgi:predicted DNA-binding protein with PD1-like motif